MPLKDLCKQNLQLMSAVLEAAETTTKGASQIYGLPKTHPADTLVSLARNHSCPCRHPHLDAVLGHMIQETSLDL